MPSFHIHPGPLAVTYTRALARLDDLRFADALWTRQLGVWPGDESTRQAIANRLGWLAALDAVEPQLPRLGTFGEAVRLEAFTDVVLLGMGGSSLAPEVLRTVFGVAAGYPRFHVLDSVDPDAVRAAMAQAGTSLFVVASKSGTTIEPNAMAAEARRRVEAAGHAAWGTRFVAITDEHTDLHRRAVADNFREVFINPADIGGRYSALSLFGLVPAALMGIDIASLCATARQMESACRSTPAAENPGLALGAMMASGAQSGRDKLTLRLPPALGAFGLWVEQLVAESTGKQGKGVVPISSDPAAPVPADRTVVVVTLGTTASAAGEPERGGAAGAPVVQLQMDDASGLGGEFLRWEVATAAAGVLMAINPFDEPNVQQAKDATRRLLAGYERDGRLPIGEAHASTDGARSTLSDAALQDLAGDPPDAFLRVLRPADYLGVLAFLPPNEPRTAEILRGFCDQIAIDTGCATMLGYGPRYLHSTGQLHKGGANNGVFLVLTAPPAEDLAIPGERFSFGVLEMAQAVGDFQSLDRAGRRALHLDLPRRDPELLQRLLARLSERRRR